MVEIVAPNLSRSGYLLKNVILEDFKRDLPISGGWGYSQEDAVIVEAIPDYVALERLVLEKRIYEELIVFRGKEDRYSGIDWKIARQSLLADGGRSYDRLEVDVTCHRDRDWEELRQEFQSNNGFKDSPELRERHFAKNRSLMRHFRTEIWFDITASFPGA